MASRSSSKNRTHNYLFCIWFDSKKKRGGRKISRTVIIVARVPFLSIQKVSASSGKKKVLCPCDRFCNISAATSKEIKAQKRSTSTFENCVPSLGRNASAEDGS